jgi:galactonate dehydratase
MKISTAKIYFGKIGSLRPVLVEIGTTEGISGVGEAAVAYGIGATAAAAMSLDLIQSLLLGRDPFRIEEIWSDMYDHSFWAKGGGPIVFAGMSAIEQALWDLKGKALNLPVYEFLGGKMRDHVRTYANGWSYRSNTPAEFFTAAERVARDGYSALKCYPLAMPRPDGGIRHVTRRAVDRSVFNLAVERVRAIRQAVGPEVAIMVDLSGGLTTSETIALCQRLEEFDILFFEEPADPFDLGALKKVSDHIDTALAVGERVYTRHGFRPILEAHAADVLQPDIGNTGGIMEAKKIASMAEAYNAKVALHVCASPVATAAALQVDACISNFSIQEVYPYRSREHFEIVDSAPEDQIKDGVMPIPDRPGIGTSLNTERVRPFLWAEVER